MGKKRIKAADLVQESAVKKPKVKEKKSTKAGSDSGGKKPSKGGQKHGRIVDIGEAALKEAELVEAKQKKAEKEIVKAVSSEIKADKAKKTKARSKRYLDLAKKVNPNRRYNLTEAVRLLLSFPKRKLDETVELHLVTLKEKVTGKIKLPHGTGKKTRVAIASEKLIAEIEKGKIDFDVLIASPALMPKIANVAKILGPKGLMPNPKNGTITDKPEAVLKKLAGGEIQFKTEKKEPLIHLILGKVSFGEKKIGENLASVFKTIDPKQIKKAVLCSTYSPGIKLEI